MIDYVIRIYCVDPGFRNKHFHICNTFYFIYELLLKMTMNFP